MRTNKILPGRSEPSKYLCKVALTSYWQRALWWLFRRYLLNEDHYRVVTRYTGPRPRGAHSTLRKDATSFRYYIERRRKPARIYRLSDYQRTEK